MANDNWDALLQDLGSDTNPAEKKSEPPSAAEVVDEKPVAEVKSAPVVPAAEVELPDAYPTPKPSAWEALADDLGVPGSPVPEAKKPEAVEPEPVAERPAKPTPPPTPPPAPRAKQERVEKPAEPAAKSIPAERPARDEAKSAPAEEPKAAAPASSAPAAAPAQTSAPAQDPAPKAKGFTGWFPFAGRRAKPEAAAEPPAGPTPAPETPAAEEPPAEAKLPEDLFAAPEALVGDSTPETSEEAGDGTEKPKRRRRRRGGRRRRKSSDTEGVTGGEEPTEKAEAVDEAIAQPTEASPDGGGFADGVLAGGAAKAAGEGDDEDGERPRRRRRRRRRRGRGRGADGATDENATSGEGTESTDASADSSIAPSYGAASDNQSARDEDGDDEPAAISHKNITPWPEAIGVLVDANIAARATRKSAAVGSGRGGGRGRGGRSRGGGGRRRAGGGSNGSGGEASS